MVEWVVAMVIIAAVVWFVSSLPTAAAPSDVDHLCYNGEFMPGRMEDCSCRSEWRGLY